MHTSFFGLTRLAHSTWVLTFKSHFLLVLCSLKAKSSNSSLKITVDVKIYTLSLKFWL